jgi:hypothetical protein
MSTPAGVCFGAFWVPYWGVSGFGAASCEVAFAVLIFILVFFVFFSFLFCNVHWCIKQN